ncbi:hypothetical protein KY339_00915, partial [Candidatus Woesearchaeota archaeon]|nr:hypothetical protein [Candidatus Woesearchaeota archaeon]
MNKKMFLGILVVLFSVLMSANVFAPTGCEYGGCGPWLQMDSGTTADLYGVDTQSTRAYAVGAGGTILYTGDGGETWSSQTSGTSADLYDVYESPMGQACAVGASGTILYTNDGGTTWSSVTSGTTEDLHAIHVAGTYASNLIVVG